MTRGFVALAAAGIVAIVEPAFWLGQPRTQVGSFIDYFSSLIGWERFRARQFGIAHFCTMALNPKESNDASLALTELEVLIEPGIGILSFDPQELFHPIRVHRQIIGPVI